jgi:phosphoenolpyruvate carboxylase
VSAFARAEADAPLRRDVRLLGAVLGKVLVEQEGDELLEAEERIRLRSRDARATGDVDAVRDAVRMLAPGEQANVLRAFGLYFQLVNIAEQHHRLRRRRQYAAEDQQAPRESLADAFERLRGIDTEELRARVSGISLELVLTAHPTEATRRTYLLAHLRVAELLAALDAAASTVEEEHIESELGEQITILWQTDEVRHGRPRLTDEIRHGLWFFEHSLPDAAERLLAEYRARLPDAPSPLSFGTWIGGDMDGNPAADAETIREALDRARELALGRYRSDVRELAVALAMNRSLVEVSAELDESITRDERELPEYAGTIGRRSELEPYRRKLSFIWWRLGNDGYDRPAELLADVVYRRLEVAVQAFGHGKRGRIVGVAKGAIESFHKINYWVNNDGLNEKQMMGQVNEMVKDGLMKPEAKPTYDKLVDKSLYNEAMKRVEKMGGMSK